MSKKFSSKTIIKLCWSVELVQRFGFGSMLRCQANPEIWAWVFVPHGLPSITRCSLEALRIAWMAPIIHNIPCPCTELLDLFAENSCWGHHDLLITFVEPPQQIKLFFIIITYSDANFVLVLATMCLNWLLAMCMDLFQANPQSKIWC